MKNTLRPFWRIQLLVVLAAVLVVAMVGSTAGSPPTEPSMSGNMRHVANLPKAPPFEGMFTPSTDLAFSGTHAVAGNFAGFTVLDIGNPRAPKVITQVVCPGAQNDVSIAGSLLFLSTDDPRSNDSCQSATAAPTAPSAWEGIKIFDISDAAHPRLVNSVETACGSHTHTLVPGKGKDRDAVFVYVSSYLADPESPGCRSPHDKISIIRVPLNAPDQATLVTQPVLFPDGGNPGKTGATWFPTSGCHDLTALPNRDLMAGACMGDGILMDISNPVRPRVITTVRDTENFAFWHSAVFSNSGDKVVFMDELGGGFAPTCMPNVGSTRGANAIYAIKGQGDHRTLVKQGYYKIPRHQTPTENCVAHYGSVLPVPGRDIMVQAWYQGGVSVWDFTDARRPHEIAYFDRGPLSPDQLLLGGAWSAYYYNGYIYVTDTQKGLDVIDIRDPRTLAAKRVRYKEFNPQTQPWHRGR